MFQKRQSLRGVNIIKLAGILRRYDQNLRRIFFCQIRPSRSLGETQKLREKATAEQHGAGGLSFIAETADPVRISGKGQKKRLYTFRPQQRLVGGTEQAARKPGRGRFQAGADFRTGWVIRGICGCQKVCKTQPDRIVAARKLVTEHGNPLFPAKSGGLKASGDHQPGKAGKRGGTLQNIRDQGLCAKIRQQLVASEALSPAGGHDDTSQGRRLQRQTGRRFPVSPGSSQRFRGRF